MIPCRMLSLVTRALRTSGERAARARSCTPNYLVATMSTINSTMQLISPLTIVFEIASVNSAAIATKRLEKRAVFRGMLGAVLLLFALPGSGVHAQPARAARPPADLAGASNITLRELLDLQLVAVQNRMTRVAETSRDRMATRTACVTLRIGKSPATPDTAALRQASNARVNMVPQAKCPRTYTSIVRPTDNAVAPPGYIDPYRVTVTKIEPWTANLVYVELDTQQGMSMNRDVCGVRRVGTQWQPACESVLRIKQ